MLPWISLYNVYTISYRYVGKCSFILKIYLFIFREWKGGRKRGGETSMCSCLLITPYWGPGPKPRHVSWLGIQPATLWFTGQCSTHWATPARDVEKMSTDKITESNGFAFKCWIEWPIICSFKKYFQRFVFSTIDAHQSIS